MATIYGLSIPVFEACVLVARADFIHRFLHSWRDFGIYLDINSNQAGPLEIIYFLAYLCPSIALGVRRLHDIGRSGKWMWLMLTVVGVIPLLYWWVQPSSNEANEWGPPATAIS